jgi:predicted O-methyltransferase YrrM
LARLPTFIGAVFLSAFLLFQVQPILARYILPWYGGSPAVWTTCMLFFQVGLLLGYSYAHFLVSRFRDRPRWQAGIHLALLAISIALLPITPAESLKPAGSDLSPVLGILHLLVCSVGLPYFAISASGPLLQHWFAESAKGTSPYRLYAVSNAGSLLGLLTYPVFVEPSLRLGQQTSLWSGGYLIYILLAAVCAWQVVASPRTAKPALASPPATRPPRRDWMLWIGLAACASLLMLATTNQICQDVAVVPFLWVLPLSLYLLTFIIAFDHARWYLRPVWIPLALISVTSLIVLLNHEFADAELHMTIQITIYAFAMFATCMVCHGEMVRRKPHPRYLTAFYLAVSLGGALGGVFVSLIAPQIFTSFWELHLGVLAFMMVTGLSLFRDWGRSRLGIGARLAWIGSIVLMAFFLRIPVREVQDSAIQTTRGFYGVLRVYEWGVDTKNHYRSLYHGRIKHGSQFFDDEYRAIPYAYYADDSGPGVLFYYHPKRQEPNAAMKFGVVGLGVGTLSAYAEPGDTVRIYEINPQVEELARTQFSYLSECKGQESVVIGDARMELERELAAGNNQQFDVFFVDAFSGDSVPVHLLTREAFELYFSHLQRDGVLVVHVTNRHLDLSEPVRVLAAELGKHTLRIERYPDDKDWEEEYSCWVLISDNRTLLRAIEADDWSTPWEADPHLKNVWTDDYSNLLEVIDWE